MGKFSSSVFPSHADLLEICHYDPEKGIFTLKKSYHKKNIGKCMGHISRQNYRRITIGGKRYAAGPLAWFYVTGVWPTHDIDHIDRNRSNNKFSNLRQATVSQNQFNAARGKNKSGYRGVSPTPEGKWKASLRARGKYKFLGSYDTAEKAALRYDQEAIEQGGEFAILNFPKSVHRDWILV